MSAVTITISANEALGVAEEAEHHRVIEGDAGQWKGQSFEKACNLRQHKREIDCVLLLPWKGNTHLHQKKWVIPDMQSWEYSPKPCDGDIACSLSLGIRGLAHFKFCPMPFLLVAFVNSLYLDIT